MRSAQELAFKPFASLPLLLFLLLGLDFYNGAFTAAAVTQIDGEAYLAEWLEHGPSLRLCPKTKNGTVLREDYFVWDILHFQEKVNCYCCKTSTLGYKMVNCNDEEGLGPLVDLKRNVTWQLEEVEPGRRITWTTNDFAGEAVIRFTFEDLFEDRTVSMTNGIETRVIQFSKGGLKFSVNITNYSPFMFNITEEPDRYFGMTTMNRFYLSRPAHNTTELGIFNLGPASKFSQYQIPLVIRTKEEPFMSVTFIQTMFSVQDPPSSSRELLPESEWGFEVPDAVQRDLYVVDGEIMGQDIEFIFGGARSVYYDPDLSILFGEEAGVDDGEDGAEDGVVDETSSQGHKEGDGADDVALPVALSLSVGGLLVVVVVVIGFFAVKHYRAKKANKEDLDHEETVNF
ncbi:hypothetical protein QOT17_003222 [Balamuthia mandrillaris]